jgi:hypothetical protein
LWEECQTNENKTQTQVVEGKEDLLRYQASTLDLSKNGTGPRSSRLWGFYASECRSKQAGRTKARLQLITLAQGYSVPP